METACSGIRQKTGRRPAIARVFLPQSGKIAANYKKPTIRQWDVPKQTGLFEAFPGVLPGLSGRRRRDGVRDGSRSGCGVSGAGKKNVRPCKPDVSVHFADIQHLLAEREGFEPPVQLPVHRISSAARSTTPAPLLFGRGRRTCARSPDPKPLFWDCKYRHIFYFSAFSCEKKFSPQEKMRL